MISPRMTPQMIGLGLIEAIPEADILAREDPDDRDGDGISGRANRVWSVEQKRLMLGRFGWKAGQPTRPAASGGSVRRATSASAAGSTRSHGATARRRRRSAATRRTAAASAQAA